MQISGDARDIFLAAAQMRSHDPGTELIREADDSHDVFLMIEGTADVLVHSPDGKLVIYGRCVPGDLVGTLAAIDGGARSASVVARGGGRTAWVSRRDFLLLLEVPGFAHPLHLHLVQRVRSLSERVYEFGTQLVRERLVRELLRLIPVDAPAPYRLDPAPAHLELAARIATHREAVSREMSRLARAGLVTRKGRALHIPSRAELAASLDEASEIRPEP